MTRPESAVERILEAFQAECECVGTPDPNHECSACTVFHRTWTEIRALEARAEAAERLRDEAVELLRVVNKSPTHGPDAKFYEVALHESFFDRLAALLARHDAKGGEG